MADHTDDRYAARYQKPRSGIVLPVVLGLLLLLVTGGMALGIWSGAITLSGDAFGPRSVALAQTADGTATLPLPTRRQRRRRPALRRRPPRWPRANRLSTTGC